jgi:hypothetical protein
LTNGQLIVENNWVDGTYCQWMISAQDHDGYVTLEFQNFDIYYMLNRILVYDGPDDQSMLIGELFGTPNHKVVKSISSEGKSIFIDIFFYATFFWKCYICSIHQVQQD